MARGPKVREQRAGESAQNMGSDQLDVLCKHCGQAFSTFLHQMEEQNAKVTCPSCGKPHEPEPPAKGAGAPARKR